MISIKKVPFQYHLSGFLNVERTFKKVIFPKNGKQVIQFWNFPGKIQRNY